MREAVLAGCFEEAADHLATLGRVLETRIESIPEESRPALCADIRATLTWARTYVLTSRATLSQEAGQLRDLGGYRSKPARRLEVVG